MSKMGHTTSKHQAKHVFHFRIFKELEVGFMHHVTATDYTPKLQKITSTSQ